MSKIFVGSVAASLLDDTTRIAELEAINEDELLPDPVDELVELSLELRMTF